MWVVLLFLDRVYNDIEQANEALGIISWTMPESYHNYVKYVSIQMHRKKDYFDQYKEYENSSHSSPLQRKRETSS